MSISKGYCLINRFCTLGMNHLGSCDVEEGDMGDE